ncbi:MAG TPA: hypothetical protein IAA29_13135 [Candidatus Paenibacillus intestinavium]|nr:hypothetical protein [Candidatus Paenibacillus intestinavium]
MIPFENTWPYERIMKDFYVDHCPFCDASQVLLPLKQREIGEIKSGKKKHLVFPCCYAKLQIIDMDDDYLLADSKVRSFL